MVWWKHTAREVYNGHLVGHSFRIPGRIVYTWVKTLLRLDNS